MMGRREEGQGQFFFEFNLDEMVPPVSRSRACSAAISRGKSQLGALSAGASYSPRRPTSWAPDWQTK